MWRPGPRPRAAGPGRLGQRPPTYAPDLNPQEGIWSLVKRNIGNVAAADLSQITRAVKRKLKMLQYRPEVIDGCLAGTGLVLDA
ncbi:transposase [Streptomyces sp. NBC_00829]|uniref:transposase n=1 Tax=Streptomyces sp. NBC_00829 TaxID=2903679 RepID=UPI003862F861|nr:transposase [Streptomyces sp. NBC_00829]